MGRKYNHELPEWPNFTWRIDMLANRLAEVSFRQGLLIGRMESIGLGQRQTVTLDAVVEEVRKSSEIEGEFLDEAQVRSSVALRLGIDIAGLPRADRHVDGVVEMAMDATQNCQAALTAERLWNW